MRKLIAVLIFTCMIGISYHASATTVMYNFDNVFQDNGSQITGSFNWTYTEGDFEGGSGVFTELLIPDDPYPLSELTITTETKLIEITLLDNINDEGVDIQLVFVGNGFTIDGGDLDLVNSKWSLRGGGLTGTFDSGSVTPQVVPIPAAAWLMVSGMLGLVVVGRRT